MTKNPKITAFIDRAPQWAAEMHAVRAVFLGCGLDEEIKWGKPCFGRDGANIAIFQPMKNFLSVMFFKGQLMQDPADILRSQGPNSQSALRIEFTDMAQVGALADLLRDYVADAVAIEKAGLKVDFREKEDLDLAEELVARLASDPALKDAFENLTPGRQRAYNMHFSGAKQSATRAARIEKCIPRILDGLGLNDR